MYFWPKERHIFGLRAIWITEEAAEDRQGGLSGGDGEAGKLPSQLECTEFFVPRVSTWPLSLCTCSDKTFAKA